jgi:hypothetical protein
LGKGTWLGVIAAFTLACGSFTYSILKGTSDRAKLCHAERGFIERQESQSRQLIARGLTFGIPRSQIPALLKQSEESEHRFLEDLSC